MLGAGKGLENGVNEGFPRVTNTVYIWSQGPTQIPYQGMPIGRQIQLEPADVEAIAKNVASVSVVNGQNSVGIWGGSPPYTVHKSKNGAFSVQGGFAGIENINACESSKGRSINELDEQQRRKVAMIGQRVRDQLFAKDENAVGGDITVNGITFQVIGVFKSTAERQPAAGRRAHLSSERHAALRLQPDRRDRQLRLRAEARGPRAAWPKNDVKSVSRASATRSVPNDKGVFGSFNLQDEYDKVQGLFTGIQRVQLDRRHRHDLRGRRRRRATSC